MPCARTPWTGSQVTLSNVTPAPPCHVGVPQKLQCRCMLGSSSHPSHSSNEGEWQRT